MSVLIPPNEHPPDPEVEQELEYLYLRRSLVENLIRHLEEYASSLPAAVLKPKRVA